MRISAHFASAHATSALICCAHALLSAGPAQSGVDWSKLPTELLSAILQNMPQHHRFSCCTTISTAWAAAAVAATHSIRSSGVHSQRCSTHGLHAHRGLRHSFHTCHCPMWAGNDKQLCSLHLPCARLHVLEVLGVGVQLMPGPLWQPASPVRLRKLSWQLPVCLACWSWQLA